MKREREMALFERPAHWFSRSRFCCENSLTCSYCFVLLVQTETGVAQPLRSAGAQHSVLAMAQDRHFRVVFWPGERSLLM